ncbi:MAG: WecB/TagA/CpsF family glycosyltransferase [Chloroflexi bacterium]|nr:WecB/TagA/CpsF family glycosyltransferase [Chloroflexota bacterium]
MSTRVDILGVLIDKVNLRQTEVKIGSFVSSGKPHQIVTVNMDFIRRSRVDPRFKELINSSSLVVPDGMPVLWAAKAVGDPLPQRITGLDLLHIGCRLAERGGHGIYLLGAEPGVAWQASKILCRQYPDLRIAGTYSPPFGEFSDEENRKLIDLIACSDAKYLFVAFGCPKQDYWIRDHLLDLHVPVSVGVGGIFNYITGQVKRAPGWVQSLGFEWLFRMAQQPQLAKRYLVNDLPVFLRAMSYGIAGARAARAGHARGANGIVLSSASLRRLSPGSDV